MLDDNPAEYGDSCVSFYDYLYPNIESGRRDALIALARGGPVIEIGLATNRVACRLNKAVRNWGVARDVERCC